MCVKIYNIRTVTRECIGQWYCDKNALNVPCGESILHNGKWIKFNE